MRKIFESLQLTSGTLWVPLDEQPRKVQTHGDGRNVLCRPVVELSRQFSPGIFFLVDDLVPLLAQGLVQAGVLQGDGGLIAEQGQQLGVLGRVGPGLDRRKEHGTIGLKANAQGDTDHRLARLQGIEGAQFRVVGGCPTDQGASRVDCLSHDATVSPYAPGLVFARHEAPVGRGPEQAVLVVQKHESN